MNILLIKVARLIQVASMIVYGLGTATAAAADSLDVRVMSFNVWSAEDTATGRQRIINTIQQAGADIIGFQEMGSGALTQIATATGFYPYSQQKGSEAILSRYPILEVAPENWGVLVEFAPGHEAWIFNTHLFHAPYGPYQLNGIAYAGGRLYNPREPADITRVVQDQITARGGEMQAVLRSAANSGALTSGLPVFLTGDFNEASHLDWTAAAASAGVHVAEVAWPASLAVVERGFRDSWRTVYPNEVTHPGRTWSPVYDSTYLNRGDNINVQPSPIREPQDRIDMVYFAGEHVSAIDSRRSGPAGGDLVEEWEMTGYPSDHNGVTSTFRLAGVDETRLTFRGLSPSGANLPGEYGSRALTSSHVNAQFSAQGGSPDAATWKVWDDATWPDGVAYLDSGAGEPATGGATYSVTLTADPGKGVNLRQFTLLDYLADDSEGQTVQWDLLQGDQSLYSGTSIVPDDGRLDVATGLNLFVPGPLELRITHVSGANNRLGFDDMIFDQSESLFDYNGDDRIDGADAQVLFGTWGSSILGDVTGDRVVDAADAGQLFAAWTGETSVSIPEPKHWVLVLLGLATCGPRMGLKRKRNMVRRP